MAKTFKHLAMESYLSGFDFADFYPFIHHISIVHDVLFSMASKPCNISAGLEPVLSHTEKSSIASYYRQFYTNIQWHVKC